MALKKKKISIFRLRLGKYRIIFTKERDVMKVVKIDTRVDVYKQ